MSAVDDETTRIDPPPSALVPWMMAAGPYGQALAGVGAPILSRIEMP